MSGGRGRIPIIKNKDSVGKQTIRVLDWDGNEAGSTYPKRAAGLVKKGRACYVNDFTIRLNMSDTILKSEVIKMDNNIEMSREEQRLYFNPRKWSLNKESAKVGGRSFMQGPDGELAEAFMIGDWSNSWTEIISETLLLPKNTDCRFTFWLNGGENDKYNEVCRLEVIFNNDFEHCYTYNLNRNFIRPVKKMNGWELYEIPFRTADNEYTQLKFCAQRAYMTVMTAKDASAYESFPDSPDPFEVERPQRHNLIFANGWPADGWYSTKELVRKYGERKPEGQDSIIPAQSRLVSAEMPAGGLDLLQGKMDEVVAAWKDVSQALEGFSADLAMNMLREELDEVKDLIQERGEDEDMDWDDLFSEFEGAAIELESALEDATDQMEEMTDQMRELVEALLEK